MVTFSVLLGLSIIAPILPQYAETFHVNYTLVGLVVAAFGIARLITDLPAGYLARQFNKKIVLSVGLLLIIFSSVLAGFAPSFAVLFLARLIEGVGSAIYVTTALVYLGQVSSPERRGTLMSIYSGFLLLGSIFGPSFGGEIAIRYGIQAPFFAYAIIVSLGLIPTLFLPKIENQNKISSAHSENFLSAAISTLKYKPFLFAFPAIFTLFFVRTGVRSTLVPLFMANDLGYEENRIGLLLTLAAIATAITMVPIGKISDKIGRRLPLLASLFLSVPVVLWFPFNSNFTSICVCAMLYGAFTGLSGPLAAFVTDLAPPKKLEIYMAVYRMVGDIGFIVGPLSMGKLVDLTGTQVSVGSELVTQVGWIPFAVVALIMFFAGIVLMLAPKQPHTEILKEEIQIPGF